MFGSCCLTPQLVGIMPTLNNVFARDTRQVHEGDAMFAAHLSPAWFDWLVAGSTGITWAMHAEGLQPIG